MKLKVLQTLKEDVYGLAKSVAAETWAAGPGAGMAGRDADCRG